MFMHIFPINDLIENNTDEYNDKYCCKCDPEIDAENLLITHNSLDRRECFETPRNL